MNRQRKVESYYFTTKSVQASDGNQYMHTVLVNKHNPAEAWMHLFGGDAEDMDRLQNAIKARGWFNTKCGWKQLRVPLMAVPTTTPQGEQLSLNL